MFKQELLSQVNTELTGRKPTEKACLEQELLSPEKTKLAGWKPTEKAWLEQELPLEGE